MSEEDVRESILHPEHRRLEVMTVGDYEEFSSTIEMLMGTKVSDRREYLFENVDFSVINR